MPKRSVLPAALYLALVFTPTGRAEPPLLQIDNKSDTPIRCAAWSADGKVVASGCENGTIQLTEIPSGKLLTTLTTGAAVTGIAFAPDGKTIAIRQPNQTMSQWDIATGKRLRSGGFPNYKAHLLAFKRDGNNIIAAAYGEFVNWNINGGASGSMWNNPPAGGYAAVAADGSIMGRGSAEGLVQMMAQMHQITNIQVGPTYCMAFGPGAKWLATGAKDNNVYVWDLGKRDKTATLTGLPAPAKKLSFAADGSTLAATTEEATQVRVWDLGRLRTRRLLTNTRGVVAALELSPDGKYLVTIAVDGKALVWNVATRELDHKGPPLKLSAAEMTGLWKDLASSDFSKADAAWRRLAACGDNAVPFLKEQIKPISMPPLDMKHVAKLIADLGHDKYTYREKANKELLAHGELVITPLQKLLDNPPSEEARARAEKILKKIKEPVLTPQRVQVLEAIEMLEIMHTPDARKLLEEIAQETLIAQFRQDALLALERLARGKEK